MTGGQAAGPAVSHGDRPVSRAGPLVNRGALAAALRAAVRGEVRFDAGSRALYATDASNYRQLPLGVVSG